MVGEHARRRAGRRGRRRRPRGRPRPAPAGRARPRRPAPAAAGRGPRGRPWRPPRRGRPGDAGADPRTDHEPDEGPPADREAGQLAPAEHVVGVGVVGQPGEQLEVRTPHERAAVAVVEPVQGERGGGPLGDGDEPLRRRGRRADHEPAPHLVGGAEPGDQPAVAGVPAGAAGDLDPARARRPAVEEAAGVVGAGEVVERAVLGVLHDDRSGGHPLHGLEDLDRTGAGCC